MNAAACQHCYSTAGHHVQCPYFGHSPQYRPQMPRTYQIPAQVPQQAQYTYAKRRQSVKVHLMLLLFTGGIGNVFYAMAANSKAAARYKW